ncbi:uncharacterized protein C8Q71DRAFT_909109 [Rhodofomes roseus]|uniref:Uncharacterized protein n=1 Tax=Rhodofomes roseus TaxID=34475 RepID=A0ABQ8KA94_9APHY|nr:uncharacterized protein C8Q71DRAFT_909109 [Rhodofomes roseus]KAH9834102.1 hypothetical protein C8Q71DRAFT_909109 [Rhodofomes roseus]
MVATFILTRTFAISALFVGAFDLAYAAPVPYGADVSFDPRNCRDGGCENEARNCRNGGCLRSFPVELVDFPDAPVVREEEHGSRSVMNEILERISSTPSDALADPNPGEASTVVEEASRSLDVKIREPVPAPVPTDGNCRGGGCS